MFRKKQVDICIRSTLPLAFSLAEICSKFPTAAGAPPDLSLPDIGSFFCGSMVGDVSWLVDCQRIGYICMRLRHYKLPSSAHEYFTGSRSVYCRRSRGIRFGWQQIGEHVGIPSFFHRLLANFTQT